jgi:hypothetical protein
MKNFKIVAVLGVCGAFLFSIAMDSVKYTAFRAVHSAETGEVDGVAKIKDRSGTLQVHVNVSGLRPNTTYSVYVTGMQAFFLNQLQTDGHGKANLNSDDASTGGEPLTGNEQIIIYIESEGAEGTEPTSNEQRAVSGA